MKTESLSRTSSSCNTEDGNGIDLGITSLKDPRSGPRQCYGFEVSYKYKGKPKMTIKRVVKCPAKGGNSSNLEEARSDIGSLVGLDKAMARDQRKEIPETTIKYKMKINHG